MSATRISFLVPVFNRLDLTRSFVSALRSTVSGTDWEAILIDDGSSDGTQAFLQELKPPFRSLGLPDNQGFAHAVNQGANEARADILGLLNNDLILTPNWLEPMLHLIEREPRVSVVGNVQTNPATRLVDHAGIFFDPEGMPTHAHKNRKRPPGGRWRERNACTAACMLIRRSAFQEAGGFCEEYRNGMEDVDLCVRLRSLGHRILVSHESIVGHYVSSSPGRHEANAANTEVFRRRCSALAAPWGRTEWPAEYLRRYARQFWRVDPKRAARAVLMLLGRSVGLGKKPVA